MPRIDEELSPGEVRSRASCPCRVRAWRLGLESLGVLRQLEAAATRLTNRAHHASRMALLVAEEDPVLHVDVVAVERLGILGLFHETRGRVHHHLNFLIWDVVLE
jgi:hypothetical protein